MNWGIAAVASKRRGMKQSERWGSCIVGGRKGGQGRFAGDLVMCLRINSSAMRPKGGAVQRSTEMQREEGKLMTLYRSRKTRLRVLSARDSGKKL